MKKLAILSLVVALSSASSLVAGDAVKSGPQKGDSIGAFFVTKAAGAESDGVEEGKNLCYRCRNGARPQVIVFTRSTDPKVTQFIQKLDKAIAENEDAALRGFVNLLGEDKEQLKKTAKQLAANTKTKNIPFVVPNESENGPDNYGINPKAEVTVLIASDLGVKANHAVTDAKDLNVDAVMADVKKILN